MRDFNEVQLASITEQVGKAWIHNGIWADWICRRYIKDLEFSRIEIRREDSPVLRAIQPTIPHMERERPEAKSWEPMGNHLCEAGKITSLQEFGLLAHQKLLSSYGESEGRKCRPLTG